MGRLLRYMLTGVPPEQSLLEAQDAADRVACLRCLVAVVRRRRFHPRRIVEPRALSEAAQSAMRALCEPSGLTVYDARRLAWLRGEADDASGLGDVLAGRVELAVEPLAAAPAVARCALADRRPSNVVAGAGAFDGVGFADGPAVVWPPCSASGSPLGVSPSRGLSRLRDETSR